MAAREGRCLAVLPTEAARITSFGPLAMRWLRARHALAASRSNLRGTGLRLPKYRRLTEEDVRGIWRIGRRRCSLCGKVPTLDAIGARFGVTARAIFYTLEYRREPSECPKLRVQARPLSADELTSAAERLTKRGIAWADDEQLRLAARILRLTKTRGFATELAALYQDDMEHVSLASQQPREGSR